MGKRFKNTPKDYNTLFLAVLAFTIFVIAMNGYFAVQEKNEYSNDLATYEQALKLGEAGQFADALELYKVLVAKYPDNHMILWNYGLSLAQNGYLEDAVQLYLQAQNSNVFLAKEYTFTAQFGEILYRTHDFENAKAYLEKTLQLGASENYKQVVTTLLEKISNEE